MGKNRVEAFTDAIIAIIMTILILELRTPDNPTFFQFMGFTRKIAYLYNKFHLFDNILVKASSIIS